MQGMSFLQKIENKMGRWAIPNLTVFIIAGQVLLYFMITMRPEQGFGENPLSKVILLPSAVIKGEVWRLITFVFVPPPSRSLFIIFYWMLMYLFGTSLEQHWGAARYNLYLLIGYLASVAAVFIAWSLGSNLVAENSFLYGTLFLAYARVNPNFVIHLFFVLPIQIKWLALLFGLGYGYSFITGTGMARMLVVASILNYLLFFGRDHWREFKSGNRRRSHQASAKAAQKQILHQCLACDLNSENAPKTLFRYCSKCDGQCCYCPEHIQNHEHVTADDSSLTSKT